MEGIIFDIKRFAVNDGPGIRTTIFLKGCLLNCHWCHNPESKLFTIEKTQAIRKLGSKVFEYEKTIGYKTSVDTLLKEIAKEDKFMEQSQGGVTLSGGEPLAQQKFSLSLLQRLKAKNYHTAVDTSGAIHQSIFSQILDYTDLFLYDIKTLNPYLYKKYTGKSIQATIDNFQFLMQQKATIIVRIPVIPGVNMNEEEAQRMALFLSSFNNPHFKEVHLLPFHKLGKGKYNNEYQVFFDNTPEPTTVDVENFSKPFRRSGLEVTIH
jgi:pyruvate formate lyase activating enzyme